jgi:hypothetical protein
MIAIICRWRPRGAGYRVLPGTSGAGGSAADRLTPRVEEYYALASV